MKTSIQWLKDYVDFKLSTEELARRLTMAGLEVEEITDEGLTKTLHIEITPNRPDCLNVLGIAREISAICQKPLKAPPVKIYKVTQEKFPISIENADDCRRYIATVIHNVKVQESPRWLKERIEALGLRSINNIVDITNFCLMEMGQPLHAFDLDKLEGKTIAIRRALTGEQIVTLDGQLRKIEPDVLVIADAKRPVALAGIMGGENTQITSDTKNILLESAYFSPGLIRRASRMLGLTSDSSYRFERAVHWNTVERGANRAVDLILSCAGGTVQSRTDCIKRKPKMLTVSIKMTMDDFENVLGTTVSLSKCKNILNKLGFHVSTFGKKGIKVVAPDFRGDITQPFDIVEEVARIIGYDHLPMTLPQIKAQNAAVDSSKRVLKRAMHKRLIEQGCNEIITMSMTSQKSLDKSCVRIQEPLKIINPLSQDQELMRPSMLPAFLSVAFSNANKGEKNLRCFEFGRIYLAGEERETLGVLFSGTCSRDWRQGKKQQIDFYDIKGALESALDIFSDPIYFEAVSNQEFDGGQCASVKIGTVPVGVVGRVGSQAIQKWDIKINNIYFAQIDLEALYPLKRKEKKFSAIIEFPLVVRDVSLSVKNEIHFDQIKALCVGQGIDFLKTVQFLEQYVGEKIQPGYRGVVFSLVYQSKTGTLKEEDVNQAHECICQALIDQLGVTRR